jgi:fluoroacetyl-CoA thioesterase
VRKPSTPEKLLLRQKEHPMKTTLQAGLTTRITTLVDRERTIDFMGEQARVYATPMLVRDIEIACRDLLLQHLDAGEDSVGTRIELDHTAATLMGMKVELTLSITEVQGRSVTFDVAGHDNIEPICHGRHQRFIVDVKKTEARLAAKALKARAAGLT